MTNLQTALVQRLEDSSSMDWGGGTPRDARVPPHRGKAVAVVGVRRAGKSTFLRQQLAAREAAGRPRSGLVWLSLEDDRLAGLTVADLDWMLEEIFRRTPELRSDGGVTLCLDEIQVVPGWERFVRRVLDTERVELFLSGSSAKLLSREVATSLRGRGVEVLMHPFSFREMLRHRGDEATAAGGTGAVERSRRDALLRDYLRAGGFPEAQGLNEFDRVELLRSYVDVMTIRDVIDRHQVSNTVALRWLQRELLATPGGEFSINKLVKVMKSQGIPVGKDTLHACLGHLEDAFLVRTVWRHSVSERQRMVNPRKVYPVDPGLIPLFERSGRRHAGRALETTVLLELERRGYDLAYVKTVDGFEVDFLAIHPALEPLLVQVALETGEVSTLEREVRALEAAMREHPEASGLLITMDATPPRIAPPSGARWVAASKWLLNWSSDAGTGDCMPRSSSRGSSVSVPFQQAVGTIRMAEEFLSLLPEWQSYGGRGLTAPMPVYFLIGHGIELAFKALLILDGTTEKCLRSIGHDLVRALASVPESSRGLVTPSLSYLAEWLGPMYAGKEFEYLKVGGASVPIYRDIRGPVLEDIANIKRYVEFEVRSRLRGEVSS